MEVLKNLSKDMSKEEVISIVKEMIEGLGLSINKIDKERPWGAFFVIDTKSTKKFVDLFFDQEYLKEEQNISPKILIVAPGKKLSWQYHHRRSELWNVIKGPVGVSISETDEEIETKVYDSASRDESKGHDYIVIGEGERHRLVGLDDWGIVAEIWIHTDEDKSSDEEDIVRLQDDFSRK